MKLRMGCMVLVLVMWLVQVVVGVEAPVKVLAVDYVSLKPQVEAKITVFETGKAAKAYGVDKSGVVVFNATVGNTLYVTASSPDHHLTQSMLLTIPPEGLTSPLDFVAMQMPSDLIYDLFFAVTPGEKDRSKCMVVVTACAPGKTIYDSAQGLPGSVVDMDPPGYTTRFYFGTWGPISNETNPLPNHLNGTSFDGGVLFENVDVDPDRVYSITASHPGYEYSTAEFVCRDEGRFVNGAPNQGPRAVPSALSLPTSPIPTSPIPTSPIPTSG